MKTHSLVRQTIIGILLAELLCAFAFAGTALLHEWQVRAHALDVSLRGRSDSLLGAIQDAEDPEDNVTIDPHELRLPENDVYAVYNRGGRLLGSSKGALSELIEREKDGFSSRRASGHGYRVLQREGLRVIDRHETGGIGLERPVTILYAVRSDHIWHEVLKAASFYVWLSLLAILFTAALMILLLRRALRPLNELVLAAGKVSPRALRFVPPDSTMQVRELQPLAKTLSVTMDRLRESFDRQHRFVGDAAHELKTAVAVSHSSIQLMMLRPRTTAEYSRGLNTLLEDSSRMEELVMRMLSLAQVEEKGNIAAVPVDLSQIARESLLRLKSVAQIHQVAFQENIQASAMVRIAPEQIEVLISNLVINAIQHSQPTSLVKIAIRATGQVATLSVQDYGSGISPQALPHVFERFYREDASRSRETGGVGLGLAICKSIVDRVGGTVAIESAPGTGTTVTVTLPLI